MTRPRLAVRPAARHVATNIAIGVTVAGVSWAAAPDATQTTARLIAAGILAGTAVGTRLGYRALCPRVGAATAWAAVAVAYAALVTIVFAVAPQCYGNTVPGRCSPRDLGTWAGNGLLLVACVAVATSVPAWLAKRTWAVVRPMVAWAWRTRTPQRTEEDQ